MEFLSVHNIRKLAHRKGYQVERAGVVGGRTYVQLTDDHGRVLDGSGAGISLAAAKRLLDALPDREAAEVKKPRRRTARR